MKIFLTIMNMHMLTMHNLDTVSVTKAGSKLRRLKIKRLNSNVVFFLLIGERGFWAGPCHKKRNSVKFASTLTSNLVICIKVAKK